MHFIKGQIPWNRKEKLIKVCFTCSKEFLVKPSLHKSKYCSRRCSKIKQWRLTVFNRDEFTCCMCGLKGCELHADHILPWASHPDKRYDVNNGRTLCVKCHYKTDTFPKRLIPKEFKI